VRCDDRPGELARLLGEIAEQRANVVDVAHSRKSPRLGFGEAEVALSVETRGPDHSAALIGALRAAGYRVALLSDADLTDPELRIEVASPSDVSQPSTSSLRGVSRRRAELDHGDLDVGAARGGVGHGLAGAGAEDRLAERRLRAVHGEVGGRRDLARAEQERLGVALVVVEVDRDDRAGRDLVGAGASPTSALRRNSFR
jgi:hypothetical protein